MRTIGFIVSLLMCIAFTGMANAQGKPGMPGPTGPTDPTPTNTTGKPIGIDELVSKDTVVTLNKIRVECANQVGKPVTCPDFMVLKKKTKDAPGKPIQPSQSLSSNELKQMTTTSPSVPLESLIKKGRSIALWPVASASEDWTAICGVKGKPVKCPARIKVKT